jgi:large subunit ribosomal protein L25
MVVMANPAIQAVERSVLGKAHLRAVRDSGKVPAVVYGQGKAATSVAVDEREMRRLLAQGAEGRLVDLIINGKKTPVLIKEVQRKPVSDSILHVDFNAVDLTQEIQVLVPISFIGEQAGDTHRVLVYSLREVEVRCLPTDIPEGIELDVSALQIGEVIKVEELALPAGVALVTDPEAVVVSATVAKVAEEEPAAEEDEEAAEPEVIGAKADDDEAEQ